MIDTWIPSPTEDGPLVERTRAGDREAFSELVSRHQRRIWLVCRQYVGPDDADATSQDAFIKAYTRLNAFDGRSSFSTWVTRIAINTCLDLLRKRARRGPTVACDTDENGSPLLAIPDTDADPERRARQRQAIASLERAERNLPSRQREIFRLRFYAELDLAEIADSLGIHIGTVKTQLHRAVHRVRRELGGTR